MAQTTLRDWTAETPASISARLDGAKKAQTQTQRTVGAMAIVSTMMLIACYNAYLSYDYKYLVRSLSRPLEAGSTPDILMSQAARDWATSRTINVGLIGIHVSIDDAAVLGTGALAILSLWLVLASRRENHTVGFLLRNTDTVKPETPAGRGATDAPVNYERWQIFHTIASNAQFETADASFKAIASLEGPNPLEVSVNGWKGCLYDHAFGTIRTFFFGFPVLASALVFALDRRSYFVPDPFEPAGRIPGVGDAFFWPSTIAYIFFFILLAACCRKANQYSRATENVLRQYMEKLLKDLKGEVRYAKGQ